MGRLQDGTGLTTGPTRDRDDNINVTKRNYMTTTDNNLALLQDLYLCVSATRPKNMDNLLIFLDQLMDMEEDVMYEPDTEAKYLDVFLKKNK